MACENDDDVSQNRRKQVALEHSRKRCTRIQAPYDTVSAAVAGNRDPPFFPVPDWVELPAREVYSLESNESNGSSKFGWLRGGHNAAAAAAPPTTTTTTTARE